MKILKTLSATVIALAAFGAGTANASTLFAQYFSVAEPAAYGNDFGICCSSPPATLPVVGNGSGLGADLLPVTTLSAALGGVFDQNAAGEILWWTPTSLAYPTGINATGTGTVSLPISSNMFAPNSTGGNNSNYFETAVLSGYLHGTGAPASLTVTSDDDAFIYINGKYVGGNLGVHNLETTTIDLGNLTGSESIKVFYADRAQTGAFLGMTLDNVTSGVPEPATWAMFLLGFGAIGWTLRGRRNAAVAAA